MSNDAPPPAAPPPAGPPTGYAVQPPLSPSDQRLWATLIHVGGILFGFIPALIGYLALKDRGEFIHEHTKTALNFQITMTIAAIIGGLLSGIIIIIGLLVLIAVAIVIVVFSIIAAIKANSGELYSYPLTIKFIK